MGEVASMASCSLMLLGSMETMLDQRKVDTCGDIAEIETSSCSQTVVSIEADNTFAM